MCLPSEKKYLDWQNQYQNTQLQHLIWVYTVTDLYNKKYYRYANFKGRHIV